MVVARVDKCALYITSDNNVFALLESLEVNGGIIDDLP